MLWFVTVPHGREIQRLSLDLSISLAAGGGSGWMPIGTVSKALEEFVSKKLMGNVKKGEETVQGWANTMRRACKLEASQTQLCKDL